MSTSKDEIKGYIKKHDKYMNEIASELGISSQVFYNKLRNDTIRYDEVKKIADILGYDIVWIKRD